MDGAGAGGAAPERRKQLTAAEAVNHKRQLAQMVERELALTGADSVTDFDDALQMVLVETAFGRYPKHLLDVYTGKVVGRQERGDVVKSWQHVEKMSAPRGATGDEGNDGFGDDDEILLSSLPPAEALKMLKAKAKAKKAMASMHISRDPEPEELELHELVTTQLTDTLAWEFGACSYGWWSLHSVRYRF